MTLRAFLATPFAPTRALSTLAALAIASPASVHARPDPAPAAAATPVVGPVVAAIVIEGNRRVATAALREAAALPLGTALSAAAIQPALDRMTALYRAQGGAYIAPSLVETGLDRVRVTFRVHEGVTPIEEGDEAPVPKWFDAYFGNTLACAAATTGNDLCHMWFNRDGTFLIFDPGGVHQGTWKAGKVRADGRVPICRYWRLSSFALPPEIAKAQAWAGAPPRDVAARMKELGLPERAPTPPPASAPGAPRSVKLCLTHNFRTTCTLHLDMTALSPELQRKAALSTVALRNEEGICYAHGPHKVGEVWYEWDDPLPGQAGLDREMLLPGRQ